MTQKKIPKKNKKRIKNGLTVTSKKDIIYNNLGGKVSNTENQRAYKERMYAAGYKQKMIWVPRNPDEKISRSKFMKQFEELTEGWSGIRLSGLYSDILSMVEPGREARRRQRS